MSQLTPITLIAPGSLGLNKEQDASLLDYRWSTITQNMVLHSSGQLAARSGWAAQTTNKVAADAPITSLFEWIQGDGDVQMIAATETAIFKDVDDFTDAANDITPSSTPTAGNWKFVNFNGSVVGFQRAHTPIVYAGTGDFADIVPTGTLPDGHAGTSAFGRLWIVDDDRQTIRYCNLLDETDWLGAGTGSIDMSSVWTQGMDEVTAVAAIGANLVVFGYNHIVFWADGSGSELGLDPDNLAVQDTIEGTGCISRDTVQLVGKGDLLYLSKHGVQSLTRVIQSKSNPLETLTKNVRGYLLESVAQNLDLDEIRSVYNPTTGLYILTLPTAGRTFVLNMRKLFRDPDGELVAVITDWLHQTTPTSWATRQSNDLLLGLAGEVGLYTGELDGAQTFQVRWKSGWLQLPPEIQDLLKIFKELSTKVSLSGNSSVTWNWEFDFDGQVFSKTAAYGVPNLAEWGVAEWNIAEWGGGLTIQAKTIDGSGEGQFIRIGMDMAVSSSELRIQQITLYFKLGRMT